MASKLKHAIIFTIVACLEAQTRSADQITNYTLEKTYLRPKDECFTQGIIFEDDQSVIETCGLFDESYIRRFKLNDDEKKHPKILDRQTVLGSIFLEGIAAINDKFWTLTWKNNKILVHDRKTWGEAKEPEKELPWTYGEGWGLTTDGCKFFANTGKDFILHLDENGKEIKRVHVKLDGKPLYKMNDMIYITPNLWVNVWYSNMVYRIDPDSGEIQKFFDMSDKIEYAKNWDVRAGNTPNGLAYFFEKDPNALFVTGKRWPSIYDLRFEDEDICGDNKDNEADKICASAPKSPCWSGSKAKETTEEPVTKIIAKEGALEQGDGMSELETVEVKKTTKEPATKIRAKETEVVKTTTTTTTKTKPKKTGELIPQLRKKINQTQDEKKQAFRVCMIFLSIFVAMAVLAIFFFCISSRQRY